MLVNAYGTTLTDFEQEDVGNKTTNLGVFSGTSTTAIQTLDLNLEELHRFRQKFPVWKDADAFEL